MRVTTGCCFLLALTLGGLTARADGIPKDARNAYVHAHQCFYASGADGAASNNEKCHKAACAYVAMMEKYKDRMDVAQYLSDRYNNVSDQPHETLAASCK